MQLCHEWELFDANKKIVILMLPSLFANLLNHWISVNDWQFIGHAWIDLSTCFSFQQFLIILLVPYFCCLYKLHSHVTFKTYSKLCEIFFFSALCHFLLCSNNCTQFLLSLQIVTTFFASSDRRAEKRNILHGCHADK